VLEFTAQAALLSHWALKITVQALLVSHQAQNHCSSTASESRGSRNHCASLLGRRLSLKITPRKNSSELQIENNNTP